MPHPGSYALPIRRAILDGLHVVAIDGESGDLPGLVLEAVRAAGRESDLRIVHTDGFVPEFSWIDGSTRWSPSEADASPKAFERDGAAPPLDPADLLDPRLIILVHGDAFDAPVLGARFVARIRAAAADAGRPGPVTLLSTSGEQDLPEGFAAACGCEKGVSFDCVDAYGGPDELAAFLAVPEAAASAWASAEAALDARCRVERHRGCVVAQGDGRAVIARRRRHESLGEEVFEFREIHPDGWVSAAFMVARAPTATRLENAARLAWRGGLFALRDASYARHGVYLSQWAVPDPVHAFVPGHRGSLPSAVVERFAPTLDIPLLRGVFRVHHDAWGHGILRRIVADPATRRNRRDFAMSWPALSSLLMRPDVLAAVDAGTEMLPLVAARLGGKGIARRAVGVRRLPSSLPGDVVFGPGLLSAIGHDRLPASGDAAEWAAFVACAEALSHMLHGSRLATPNLDTAARLLLGLPGRNWTERLGTGVDEQAAYHAGDYVSAFDAWIRDLVPGIDPALPFELLCGFGSIRAVIAVSEAWHTLEHLHLRHGLGRETTWPVPFASIDLGEGWRATPLAGMQALVDEGRNGPDAAGMDGLAHCVASYGRRCLDRQSLIVALRLTVAGVERRISTAELIPHERGTVTIGGRRLGLTQHRGLANTTPGPEAQAKLQAALTRITLGPTEAWLPVSEDERDYDAGRGGPAFQAKEVVDDWRAVLPPQLARLPAEAMIARIRAEDLRLRAAGPGPAFAAAG